MTALSGSTSHPAPGPAAGVRGWLLVLCVMLTVVGPAISVWLATEAYRTLASAPAASAGLWVAWLASWLVAAGATVYGMHAGIRLWRVSAHAVDTAKLALLVGLAADILTTAMDVASGSMGAAGGGGLRQTLFQLLPSLAFFTLCFAYLQRSRRVELTYRPSAPTARR